MESAKKMLALNSYSISSVANLAGFSGLVSFSRKFKQDFGCSPSEYRKKIVAKRPKLQAWKIPINEIYLSRLICLKNEVKWLRKLFIIVIENFGNETFSIEELSKMLFMNASNLNRKIQYLLQVSTLKLVRDLRLQYAAELLAKQNRSVNEVAFLAGFFDAAHLSRYFKKTFGCSPAKYRDINVCFFILDKLKYNNESNS
ncbi:MAG: helix-turn-helix domain-containing protein [Flavobacteriaceae bacterium]